MALLMTTVCIGEPELIHTWGIGTSGGEKQEKNQGGQKDGNQERMKNRPCRCSRWLIQREDVYPSIVEPHSLLSAIWKEKKKDGRAFAISNGRKPKQTYLRQRNKEILKA
jgi:hypothetical protein